MDIDPRNEKKTIVTLIQQAGLGIGVVFVALLTTLPEAWDNADLKRPFAGYFWAVTISLIASMCMLLAAAFRKQGSGKMQRFMLYAGLIGIAVFAIATILFANRLVRIAG